MSNDYYEHTDSVPYSTSGGTSRSVHAEFEKLELGFTAVQAAINALVAAGLADGDKGDIIVNTSGTVWTIDNEVVTYAKMQNVSTTDRILGRDAVGAGDVEELTLSAVLDFVGSAAQGDILYRGASTWTRLGAGTSGQYLKTFGAAANPAWADVTAGVSLSAVNVFTKNQSVTPVALTSSAASIAVDASLSNSFTHTLTENTTLAKPTNLTNGMQLFFYFQNHASAAKTLAFHADYIFSTADTHLIGTGANAKAIMSAYYNSTIDKLICVFNAGGTGFV